MVINLASSEYERMNQLDLSFLINSNLQLKGKKFINKVKFFNLLAGNNILIKQLEKGQSELEIRASWKEGLDEYHQMRKKYLIYE